MTDLVYGPLNKSVFTQTLELITKCMIHAGNKVSTKSDWSKPAPIEIIVGNIQVNLNEILSKANLTHIAFDSSDGKSRSWYYQDVQEGPLYPAEQQAISSYTGSRYASINKLLYSQGKGHFSDSKNLLIDTMLLASGINKLDPTLHCHQETFRGEHATSSEEIQHRIDLVNQGGGITEQKAFMSTSTDYSVSQGFKGNCFIIFDDIYGKSIHSYSGLPYESEYLLSPCKIMWTNYEYVNGDHVFHAKVVNPLIEGDSETVQDYQLFANLLNFAKENGISDDFVTPHIKATLEKYQDQGLLTLTDVVSPKEDNLSHVNQSSHFDDFNVIDHIAYNNELISGIEALLETLLEELNEEDINHILTQFMRSSEILNLEDCIAFNDDIFSGSQTPPATIATPQDSAISVLTQIDPLPVMAPEQLVMA